MVLCTVSRSAPRRSERAGEADRRVSATGGGISAATAGVRFLDLAIDSAGNPAVAWTDTETVFSETTTFFKRWNAGTSAWEELGGSASGWGIFIPPTSVPIEGPSLSLDGSGNPVVACSRSQPVPFSKLVGGTAYPQQDGVT